MKLNLLNPLVDWNPQLLREIKGQLKPRNMLIAAAISLIGQLLLFLVFQTQLPTLLLDKSDAQSRYCTGSYVDEQLHHCIQDTLGNLIINWRLWWVNLFLLLSTIGIFVLLVVGTYLLISNLADEERRGMLNFIRLSPQSPESILVGKLLGVPILLYLVVLLAVPLHLWAGLAAQFSLIQIFSFYGVLVASCCFFYSGALLFSLVTTWLGGFEAWLGSGGVLIFLLLAWFKPIDNYPADWLNLFSPSLILHYLVAPPRFNFEAEFYRLNLQDLQWFSLTVGVSALGVASLLLSNYGLWTYWSWQALKRRFPHPSKTILSKQQSYLLTVCFEVVIMGFVLPLGAFYPRGLFLRLDSILILNLVLFLSLILVLTPGRQALQDWARYRRQRISSRQGFWSSSLVRDLVWGEKSPALMAIALNIAIAYAMLVPWIVLRFEQGDKLPAFLSLVISFTLTLIYAASAQLIMLMRIQKQELWVIGTLSALILLSLVFLSLLSFEPRKTPGLWLFTSRAWASIEYASTSTVFLALLGQWSVLTLLTLQMTRQIRRAGKSTSKALFVTKL